MNFMYTFAILVCTFCSALGSDREELGDREVLAAAGQRSELVARKEAPEANDKKDGKSDMRTAALCLWGSAYLSPTLHDWEMNTSSSLYRWMCCEWFVGNITA